MDLMTSDQSSDLMKGIVYELSVNTRLHDEYVHGFTVVTPFMLSKTSLGKLKIREQGENWLI